MRFTFMYELEEEVGVTYASPRGFLSEYIVRVPSNITFVVKKSYPVVAYQSDFRVL